MTNQTTNISSTPQTANWRAAMVTLSLVSKVLGRLYSFPYSLDWYRKLTPDQQTKVTAIASDLYWEIQPIGTMLKAGLEQLEAGEPLDIQPPPYQVPPWHLPVGKSGIYQALWNVIQPALLVVINDADFANEPILKVILLDIVLKLDQLINTVEEICT